MPWNFSPSLIVSLSQDHCARFALTILIPSPSSGKPNPAVFRSHPQGRLPNSYNITWMVSSYTPLEEFKIKYRKIPGNEPGPLSNQLTITSGQQNRRLARKVCLTVLFLFLVRSFYSISFYRSNYRVNIF